MAKRAYDDDDGPVNAAAQQQQQQQQEKETHRVAFEPPIDLIEIPPMSIPELFRRLENISSLVPRTQPGTRDALLAAASIAIHQLVVNHHIPLLDVSHELRRRGSYVWIFAKRIDPRSPFVGISFEISKGGEEARRVSKGKQEEVEYAFWVHLGTEQTLIYQERVHHLENDRLLPLCGVLCPKPTSPLRCVPDEQEVKVDEEDNNVV